MIVSLHGKQEGIVKTVTNEESNLEEGVPTSLSNGHESTNGTITREDWLNYYTVQLRIAIEGILKHGR